MLPLIVALALAGPARAAGEDAWPASETPHFTIHHESPGAALGDYNRVEAVYDALHPALWSLVPWMTGEKTQVYLYKDPASYARGRFHPPAWSGGLFALEGSERSLAVYEPLDTDIVAHELTHLYFHSYFEEQGAQPPAWLDEGLAKALEHDALGRPDPRYAGPVIRAPAPLAAFLASRPAADAPQAWVGAWYAQAESLVWFLLKGHVEASFADFCGRLRGGDGVELALRETYGYADLAAFEKAWLAWKPKAAPGAFVGLQAPAAP